MVRRNTKLESEGAEFLVLGELLMRGISVYKTYTQMPGYDLVATAPAKGTSARIQVKSRFATGASAFFIKNIDSDFVVAAFLNRGRRANPDDIRNPDYYVFPMRVIKKYRRHDAKPAPRFSLKDLPNPKLYLNAWNRIQQHLLS